MRNKFKIYSVLQILLFSVILLLLTGCIAETPDNPIIEDSRIKQGDINFSYPKASKEWDQYIALFQKDAVSIANGHDFKPDNNTIIYLRSYAGTISGDEHLGYVWQWDSQKRKVVFISGMINDSGITNLLIHNKNNLTIDEILMSFTADEAHSLLGQYEVDYYTNIWTTYTPESKQNLGSIEDYITVKENQIINLSTYSDAIDCEEIYWKNGQARGANSGYFQTLLSELTVSIDNSNIEAFIRLLPQTLNMECSNFFETHLYTHIFHYESELNPPQNTSRKQFLQAMLSAGSSNSYAENNFCETLSHAIFKQQQSPFRHESIQLAQILLKHTDTKHLHCSLSNPISDSAQLKHFNFLNDLIKIEASNPNQSIQEDFHYTLLNALEKAINVGNIPTSALLIERLSEHSVSEYSTQQLLSYAAKSGNVRILNMLLDLQLDIDFNKTKVIESAMSTGNPKVINRLFEIGFILPNKSHALESILWSAFKYEKKFADKNSMQLFKILENNGLDFNQLNPNDRLILMSRVFKFAHAAWVDIDKKELNAETGKVYKQSVIELTKIYIKHTQNIGFQYGREKQSLLMHAVEGNLPEIVELILKHKPDLKLTDKNNDTALEIAIKEARIYILGSRKGFDKIYKTNALKIVGLLGGDTTPFKGKIN